ncbi:hypothetical protein ARMSODRAFT_1025989 [Armillaria solidipes]|uniref:Uncharacterized protein n=1 Tax=Armillaria solidipes TaxID=1076256 RepID=A0A2H3AQL3_9AGAR|nr:hypothetical protein ARMSODRAFT_1025989 [Armillaria solidipes]
MSSTFYNLADEFYTIAFLSVLDILLLCQGIWSVLTVCNITWQQKCSKWSRKCMIFTGVKLNADPESQASVVVSLSQMIVLLHLDNNGTLHENRPIKTDLCPVIIALSNDVSKMMIYSWKTEEHAHLDDVGIQHNSCLQVVFTLLTILVVRARPPSPVSPHILLAWLSHGASTTPTFIRS